MLVYHVTPAENLPSILKNGLEPRIGERSAQLTPDGEPLESVPRIYCFPSKEDLDNAMLNWLGEEFEDFDGDLVYFEINIKGLETESDCEYEIALTQRINPIRIVSIFSEDWKSLPIERTNNKNEGIPLGI